MAFYITTSANNAITDMYNSDGPFPIPPGAIEISKDESLLIAAHPIGHAAFDYIGGAVVENDDRRDAVRVEKLRRRKITDTNAEGIRRVSVVIPAINSLTAIDLMVELWPMLDTAQAGPDMILVRDIYLYAKTKITAAQTATEDQLNAYDPTTDTGWPT